MNDAQTTLKSLDDLKLLQETPPAPSALFAPDIVTPPEDWRDREEFQFSCFVFHKHEDNCINCGAVHHYADVYRAFVRKTGQSTRKLLPWVGKPIPASAEIILFTLPARKVPVCIHCLTEDRTGGSVFLVSSENAWNEAMRREKEAQLESRRRETARRNSGNPAMTMNDVPDNI